jgi:assimilatory nitrate reductase catalytic subunit
VLAGLHPSKVYLEISPPDAQELGIAPNDWVVIESRRGQIRARASVTRTVQPGQVFLPMHYASVNQLTFPAFDPYSRQPAYKACAVSVRRAYSDS